MTIPWLITFNVTRLPWEVTGLRRRAPIKVLTHLKPPRCFGMLFFDVLPFTTLASSVNSKTSKKSVQKRRGGVRCVKAFKQSIASKTLLVSGSVV